MSHIPEGEEDKFADTKGVVRSRRSKTGTDSTMTKKKKVQKDLQLYTNHYTGFSNTNPTKKGVNSVLVIMFFYFFLLFFFLKQN